MDKTVQADMLITSAIIGYLDRAGIVSRNNFAKTIERIADAMDDLEVQEILRMRARAFHDLPKPVLRVILGGAPPKEPSK